MNPNVTIKVTFPQGIAIWDDSPPQDKLLPHETRTEGEFYSGSHPVLCQHRHHMDVVNVRPVDIDAKRTDTRDMVKIVGYYCRPCDRYKVVGVER